MQALAATAPQSGGARSVTRRCRVLAVSRAAYYRRQTGRSERAADTERRAQLQRVALEWPAYGHRRITAELQRSGLVVHHKRGRRLMRADNLLCWRNRQCSRTTEAHHGLLVSPNLGPALTVSGPNQRWLADITYIRLQQEFIDLAVRLEAWSRRGVGGALDRHVEAELALAALRLALATRQVPPGLGHHSDRGAQYASQA